VILPECDDAAEVCSYPEQGGLPVRPPLGKETMYAVMTERPVTRPELGVDDDRTYLQAADAEAPALAGRFADLIQRRAREGKVAVAKIEYMVEGAPGTTQYTTRSIIREFEDGRETITSPAAVRKSLSGNMIHFAFDSAELTPRGKINLDVFGEAFLSGSLAGQIYILAGHTDDIGDDRHNEWLSLERARSAKAYLVEQFGIEPERIEIQGFGASRPLTPNTDAESRAMNRRVEFVRVQ
jgi:outer membrane protein OmpA-like peptidoglycan-associated protein